MSVCVHFKIHTSGSATVMNNIASVTLDLMCGETYIITAVGINDSMPVRPQLRQATNVTTGPCPTTITVITTSTGICCSDKIIYIF